MKCKHVTEQLLDYLTDQLDSSMRAEVQDHLSTCASCRQEVESLGAIWEKLGTIPEEEPSEAVRTRFYTMLEVYNHGLKHASASSWRDVVQRWLENLWPRRPAFSFALAVAFLLVGFYTGYRSSPMGSSRGEFAQLREEVQNMRQLVALSLLRQQSPVDRLRGVTWSSRVEHPDSEISAALLKTLDHDSNVNVRLAAVDALSRFQASAMVRQGLIESLSRQSSPLVQIAIIDLLVRIQERRSVETLRKLVQDEDLNDAVRQRARWGIEQLG